MIQVTFQLLMRVGKVDEDILENSKIAKIDHPSLKLECCYKQF